GRKKEFFAHFVHQFSWILNNEDWSIWDERIKNQKSEKLFIYDVSDKLFSPDIYKNFAQKMNQCFLNETQEGGHLSMISRPEEVTQLLRKFLLQFNVESHQSTIKVA
nr:hypothetical protein [Pseudobdellovibrionaceae bacterium]